MIYSLESIIKIQQEIEPLFKAAWDEVDNFADHVELDPDWEKAGQLELLGMWRTYTSRNDEGELVGFICVIVQSLMHSKNNYAAITDVAYMVPEYRGKFRNLLELVEQDLKEEGVKSLTVNLKSWDDKGKFLTDNRYNHTENVYIKMVN